MGPFLFNIFFCDLFLTIEGNYFTNFADDTYPYVTGNSAEGVVSELKAIIQKLFIWLAQNEMKETSINVVYLLVQVMRSTSKYQKQ